MWSYVVGFFVGMGALAIFWAYTDAEFDKAKQEQRWY